MGLRALAYVLILALGLIGATGLGLFGPGSATGWRESVSIAAPLADNSTDNSGGDNSGSDNGSSDNGGSDNGSTDNGGGDNGGGDNGSVSATSSSATTQQTQPAPQPQPQPQAQPQPQPIPGPIDLGPCQFRLGFKALRDLIPDRVGNCVTNETHNPVNGDGLQVTTNGLMVWRKADNWTAFTNGAITWLNGPCGLQSRPNEQRYPWEGQPGAVCIPGDPS